jgi:excisionase family DNA binding protein
VLDKNEIKPMLTTNDVARLLNVHINTVRRWSNSGILRAYRIGARGDRRFERLDVLKLLLEQSELAE